jgi:transposase
MARHRTTEEKRELGEQARALRAAGRSRREIQRELGIGDDLARQLLSGTEVPEGLRRPRAKDQVRAEAVRMRQQGATYDEIAAALGVSKSTCSLWLRDLPHPEADPQRAQEAQEHRLAALRSRMRRDRDARDAQGQELKAAAAASLGVITSRDLVLAFAVSYWCEGAKSKPWNRSKAIHWMNSDPRLVTLFLEGLQLLGVEADRLVLRVSIHENADEQAARAWWAQHTGVPVERFRRSTLKRHNPRTVRHNVGEGYRGCLTISVLQSRTLYEVVDGLVEGLLTQPRRAVGWQDACGEEPVPGPSGLRSAVG